LGVGLGVGRGVGLGVGLGVGAGVEPPLTVNERPIVGKVPEPQFVLPAGPGLSAAIPVHDIVPVEAAVPVMRKIA
jgi:hypothetical protein